MLKTIIEEKERKLAAISMVQYEKEELLVDISRQMEEYSREIKLQDCEELIEFTAVHRIQYKINQGMGHLYSSV